MPVASNGNTRPFPFETAAFILMLRHRVPPAVLALLTALTLASCASDVDVTATFARPDRATAMGAADADAIAAADADPEPTADLPPATSEAPPPVDAGFVQAADAGSIDVCSLYEPEQLAALLGEFWALETGVAAQRRCIWHATSNQSSGALISITVADRSGEFLETPDSGGYEFESEQGPAVAVAKDDNVIIVNVTTNDPNVEAAALNEVEAERRISGDLDRRVVS